MTTKLAIGFLVIQWVASAQAPAPAPAFEVATIKAFAPGMAGGRGRGGGGGSAIKGDRFDLPVVDLASLLPYAFRVKQYQIVTPVWTHQSRWSISAKLPAGTSAAQAPEMVQSLLVERFKLAVHREKRERPVYTLTVAEGGSKLQAGSPDDAPVWDGSFPGFSFGGPLRSGSPISGRIAPGAGCNRRFEFVPLTMESFADTLAMFLNRPVVDQTGLQGTYRVVMEVPPEGEAGMMMNVMAGRGMPPPPVGGEGGRRGPGGPGGEGPRPPGFAPGCPDPGSFFADAGAPDGAIIKAVQHFGLKLQQGKAPIDTIVIDHLETKPTEN